MKLKIVTQTFPVMLYLNLKGYEPNPYREVDYGEIHLPNHAQARDLFNQIVGFFTDNFDAEWENLDET